MTSFNLNQSKSVCSCDVSYLGESASPGSLLHGLLEVGLGGLRLVLLLGLDALPTTPLQSLFKLRLLVQHVDPTEEEEG